MSTDETTQSNTPPAAEPAPPSDPVVGLVSDLQNVSTDAPQAAQNETTISDNNGGRIELGEDGTGDNVIRK